MLPLSWTKETVVLLPGQAEKGFSMYQENGQAAMDNPVCPFLFRRNGQNPPGGRKRSVSCAGNCIDKGPAEGFRGIVKAGIVSSFRREELVIE